MGLKLITAPVVEPITLAEARLFLRETGTDQDALITTMISAVRRKAEHLTGRALITQTWEQSFDCWPCQIMLRNAPLQSVTSVKYYDTEGVQQTLSALLYQVSTYSEPGRIAPAYGEVWPYARPQYDAIVVRFICGYGDNSNTIPEPVKQWMFINLSYLYDNRDRVSLGSTVEELPHTMLDGLLDGYIVYGA